MQEYKYANVQFYFYLYLILYTLYKELKFLWISRTSNQIGASGLFINALWSWNIIFYMGPGTPWTLGVSFFSTLLMFIKCPYIDRNVQKCEGPFLTQSFKIEVSQVPSIFSHVWHFVYIWRYLLDKTKSKFLQLFSY